jgi:CheY-like chemotaxis protein
MTGGEPCRANRKQTGSAILIVEDEVLVRMAMAEQLRNAGYPVIEAANADEAIEVLRHSKDVGLVISDIRMPGSIDGVGLARLVRAEFPEIKIVLASGHLPSVDGVEHNGFFPKPYDVRQMIRHLKTLLG